MTIDPEARECGFLGCGRPQCEDKCMPSKIVTVGFAVVCEIDGVLVEIVAPFKNEDEADDFASDMNERADLLTDHIRWSTRTTTLPETVRGR